jgi:hypothetical protein
MLDARRKSRPRREGPKWRSMHTAVRQPGFFSSVFTWAVNSSLRSVFFQLALPIVAHGCSAEGKGEFYKAKYGGGGRGAGRASGGGGYSDGRGACSYGGGYGGGSGYAQAPDVAHEMYRPAVPLRRGFHVQQLLDCCRDSDPGRVSSGSSADLQRVLQQIDGMGYKAYHDRAAFTSSRTHCFGGDRSTRHGRSLNGEYRTLMLRALGTSASLRFSSTACSPTLLHCRPSVVCVCRHTRSGIRAIHGESARFVPSSTCKLDIVPFDPSGFVALQPSLRAKMPPTLYDSKIKQCASQPALATQTLATAHSRSPTTFGIRLTRYAAFGLWACSTALSDFLLRQFHKLVAAVCQAASNAPCDHGMADCVGLASRLRLSFRSEAWMSTRKERRKLPATSARPATPYLPCASVEPPPPFTCMHLCASASLSDTTQKRAASY